MRSPAPPRIRTLVGLAVVGPSLALGGVWPETIPVFALLVAAALWRLRARGRRLGLPTALPLGLLAVGATLLQVLPLPGLRAVVAPSLDQWIELSTVGLDASVWPGLSPTPADTGLEALRLAALCGLVLACAQLSWRVSALMVAIAGVTVASIGLLQHGLGIESILGVYDPIHASPHPASALRSTFVNPNHQSGLLLLGLFATAGLALAPRPGLRTPEQRLGLALALGLQSTALVLSLSRAALLAGALAVIVAAGLLLAALRDRDERARPALLALAALLGVAATVAMLGAWHELGSLGAGQDDPALALRTRMLAGAPALLGLSPLMGIGRGAFGDVFAGFDPAASHVWFSHLECAPLAMLVEWGPLLGGALVVGLPAWWISAMRGSGAHDDALARRVVLLGLLAVALQGLADFSLEFLGVAAPACALAGALSPRRGTAAPRVVREPIAVLVAAALLSPILLPSTWAHLTTDPERADEPTTDDDVAARPLHAALHRRRARTAALAQDVITMDRRARAAVLLQPGHVDGWMLLATARARVGDRVGERRATAEALRRLHRPIDAALAEHLVRREPDPAALAELVPAEGDAWEHLVRGLLEPAPRHAEAIAAAASRRRPDDPAPLRYRFEASLRLDRLALALHHARLWRQLDPRDVQAHLAVTRALQARDEPPVDELVATLERALQQADVDDPTVRGRVEEQLLRALLRRDAPSDRPRIDALAQALRRRPADDETRRRWLALVEPLRSDLPR